MRFVTVSDGVGHQIRQASLQTKRLCGDRPYLTADGDALPAFSGILRNRIHQRVDIDRAGGFNDFSVSQERQRGVQQLRHLVDVTLESGIQLPVFKRAQA